jgi:leucyl-tRNA synthetase
MVMLLSPIVPHVCHGLWQALGHKTLVVDQAWPQKDSAALAQDNIELGVQVNGKLRGRIQVPVNSSQAVVEAAAMADANVLRFVEGKEIKKIIVVPGKLVSIVVAG